MKGILLLSWRYLTYQWVRSSILVVCIALVATLPIAVEVLVQHYAESLTRRARATPLVVGAPGSRYDLLMTSLYFRGQPARSLSMAEISSLRQDDGGLVLPLIVRHTAKGYAVVGVDPEYREFRGLRLAGGRWPALLGEAALGSKVARSLGLTAGDQLLTDGEKIYDISATYPLLLTVSGVLAPSESADDWAVFVDTKTAWVVEGIGHGHQDVGDNLDENLVLSREDGAIATNAAILEYNRITLENIASFHFHAEPAALPVTAAVVVPRDDRARTILRSRLRGDERLEVLEPERALDELLGVVFRVRRFFQANELLVSVATGLLLLLVVLLSLELRRGEMATLFKLGCARGTILRLQLVELLVVVAAGLSLASVIAGVAVIQILENRLIF